MEQSTPHWHRDADFSNTRFFIRKMNTVGYVKASHIPESRLPLFCFLYLTDGELLAEVEDRSYMCYPGQMLLIPQNHSFSIQYYNDAVGYTGGFSLSVLPDVKTISNLNEPFVKVFWFDDAIFVNELFKMMIQAFKSRKNALIAKELDLLLTLASVPNSKNNNPMVTQFMDSLFNVQRPVLFADDYAREAGVSLNWLNRVVRSESGRSVGAWIDQARISRAKRLLQETDMPIIDVAVAAGIEDQSYFARFFKRHCGMTPSAFRVLMKGKHG